MHTGRKGQAGSPRLMLIYERSIRLDEATSRPGAVAMSKRHVRLFKNGRNQAVRIPREFELPGEDATIRKEGQRLIIEAAPPRSLLAVVATLQTLDKIFPPIEDLPAEPVPASFD